MMLYISLLTILFSIVLFLYNSKVNGAINYLICFLVPLSLYGIYHHLLFFNDSPELLALVNVQTLPLYYIAPPMLYFYVRNTLQDKNQISKKDYIHFLPTLIGFISVLPFIFSEHTYKIEIAQQFLDDTGSIKTAKTHWFYPNYVNVILRPIQLFGYSLFCIFMIWKYSLKIRIYSPSHQRDLLLKWLTSISIIACLIGASYMAMTYIFFDTETIIKTEFSKHNVSLFAGITYTLIPLLIFTFPGILYGIPRAERKVRKPKSKNRKSINIKSNIPQENPDQPFHEISQRILDYIQDTQPYLNPKFKIDDLMVELQTPKHHIYYCFSFIIKQKFTTIRSNYRVEYAKNLLLSDQLKIMTIEAIGQTSGFASKSNFFAIFKESTGLTPYEFVKQNNPDHEK